MKTSQPISPSDSRKFEKQIEIEEKLARETMKMNNIHNIIKYEEVSQDRIPQLYTEEAGTSEQYKRIISQGSEVEKSISFNRDSMSIRSDNQALHLEHGEAIVEDRQ